MPLIDAHGYTHKRTRVLQKPKHNDTLKHTHTRAYRRPNKVKVTKLAAQL